MVPVSFSLDASTERLILSSETELDVSEHQVIISFTGTINDKLRGFYRSSFTNDEGIEQVIGTTQMQSTDCRRAFPAGMSPISKQRSASHSSFVTMTLWFRTLPK